MQYLAKKYTNLKVKILRFNDLVNPKDLNMNNMYAMHGKMTSTGT